MLWATNFEKRLVLNVSKKEEFTRNIKQPRFLMNIFIIFELSSFVLAAFAE